jgi:hypothetical protein
LVRVALLVLGLCGLFVSVAFASVHVEQSLVDPLHPIRESDTSIGSVAFLELRPETVKRSTEAILDEASTDSTSPISVPIPPSVWLFCAGLVSLAAVGRRKSKRI